MWFLLRIKTSGSAISSTSFLASSNSILALASSSSASAKASSASFFPSWYSISPFSYSALPSLRASQPDLISSLFFSISLKAKSNLAFPSARAFSASASFKAASSLPLLSSICPASSCSKELSSIPYSLITPLSSICFTAAFAALSCSYIVRYSTESSSLICDNPYSSCDMVSLSCEYCVSTPLSSICAIANRTVFRLLLSSF